MGTTDTTLTVPDAITPIVGWREMRATVGRWLTSPYTPMVWTGNQWYEAYCLPVEQRYMVVSYTGTTCSQAPGLGCGCGFHAVPQLFSPRPWSSRLMARVELAGRVIQHKGGWRAQFARLTAIVGPSPHRLVGGIVASVTFAQLADRLGVELLTYDQQTENDIVEAA